MGYPVMFWFKGFKGVLMRDGEGMLRRALRSASRTRFSRPYIRIPSASTAPHFQSGGPSTLPRHSYYCFCDYRSSKILSQLGVNGKGRVHFCTNATNLNSMEALKSMSLLEPTLERNKLDYRDSLDLLWNKVRKLSTFRLVRFIKRMVEMGEITSKSSLYSIINRLRKRRQYRDALDVTNWIISEKPFEVTEKDYLLQIDLHALDGHIQIAEMFFYRLAPENRTEMAYFSLLAAYVRNNMIDKAENIVDKLRELRLVTGPVVEQMMLLYDQACLHQKIPQLLSEAQSLGVYLDAGTLNTYLRVQGEQADLASMEKIFDELESSQRSNAWTYIFMASAYFASGFVENAKAALSAAEAGLRNSRFKKQRKVYNRILRLYGEMKDLEGVERTWAVLSQRPLVAMHNYLFMLEALANIGEVDRAEQIFEMLQKIDGRLTQHRQYIAMIGVYCKQGLMEKANALASEMPKKKIRQAPELYHHLINGYLKCNEIRQALDTFEKGQSIVQHRSNKVWYETLLTVLNIYAERGDIPSALECFKHCKAAKRFNDIRMFNVLLKTYITAQSPAHGVVTRMLAMGFEPNEETRRLISELTPIREEFYRHRFERKIFGKPHLQWLRWVDPEIQRRFFKRAMRKKKSLLLEKAVRGRIALRREGSLRAALRKTQASTLNQFGPGYSFEQNSVGAHAMHGE